MPNLCKLASFLTILIVATVAVAAIFATAAAAAAAASTNTDEFSNNVLTLPATNKNTNNNERRRRLNVVNDLWNNYGVPVMNAISSAFGGDGGVFGSDEYDDTPATATSSFLEGNDGVVNWGRDRAWQDWLALLLDGGLLNGILDDINVGGLDLGDGLELLSNLDLEDLQDGEFDLVCTAVELAIGMTPTFGKMANCDCEGTLRTGMEIQCAFDECVPVPSFMAAIVPGASTSNTICGNVEIAIEFGIPDGTVTVRSCADVSVDDYDEICFSYMLDVRNTDGDIQQCEATYGGNICDSCSIENLCLSMDCSSYLPGGKTVETCQLLSMIEAEDIVNWFPTFDAFRLPGRGSSRDPETDTDADADTDTDVDIDTEYNDIDTEYNDLDAFLPDSYNVDEDVDDDDLIDWNYVNSALSDPLPGGMRSRR